MICFFQSNYFYNFFNTFSIDFKSNRVQWLRAACLYLWSRKYSRRFRGVVRQQCTILYSY